MTTNAAQLRESLSAACATLLLAASGPNQCRVLHHMAAICGLQQHLKTPHSNQLQQFDLRCAGGVVSHAEHVHKSLQSQTDWQHRMHLQCATASDFWCKVRSQEGSSCHTCCSLQGEWQHSQGARFASKQGRACSSKACHSKEGAVVPHAMTSACLLS